MKKEVLLGDEAVALAAVQAGLTAGYSYPGTPASEIMEYLIKLSEGGRKFVAKWCVNEKVACEEALGVSFAGKRALVSFKHVGLNVAADPFINSAITGANGGLVVVVADDPGMHSSQDEQDSRYYADFARVLCLEPANHQEAYDMTREAFDLSERFGLPVMVRLVTRLAHSRSSVLVREPRQPNQGLNYGRPEDWTLLPANAQRRFRILLERQKDLKEYAEGSPFNQLFINDQNKKLGVVVSGLGYNYFKEAAIDLAVEPSSLKISTYPFPENKLRQLIEQVEEILVIEEGYPFIERLIRGVVGITGKKIRGKMDGSLPSSGELTPDAVAKALGLDEKKGLKIENFKLAGRPPQLCVGCPHADTFKALNEALKDFPHSNVFSDIGCYTLGALPPYKAISTCVCMGASVSMAKGGAEAGIFPSIAVIGDSTFAHSGITPLLDAVYSNSDMTVIILDNGTVAMTGGQPSFGTGAPLDRLIEGLGVDKNHLRVIIPLPKNHELNVKIIREELAYHGLSVIIARRECIQILGEKKRS
ncbi:MAG TPA: indolepyruvate ferredoxin oxidoreductase [Candidatus Aminicenantes bacterium]|nr:MAG: indolepyruvate ferredoxin oxidoreductase [Candidatus Aminicenantes bacterium]HEK86155.1 indolepyruvate ferredoxin oxidoreductase [Candidatus Aminicenantes bacterium]